MNLSKKLLTAAFAVVAAFGLQAGTLYWQINNNPNNDQYAAVAILDAESGDLVGYANILDGDGGEVIGNLVTANDAMSQMQYAEISNDSSYKFVVEMLSVKEGAWERGWTSGTPMTYAELKNAGYVSEGGISAGSVNA